MTISVFPILLPVVFSDVDTGMTLQTRSIIVLPGQGFSDVVQALSNMAGTSKDDITVFIERSTKERVRMVAQSDLIRQRAVCLHVIVGLPQGACKECEKAFNHGLISEFHLCVEDKIISGEQFRSSVGPIQRPPPARLRSNESGIVSGHGGYSG